MVNGDGGAGSAVTVETMRKPEFVTFTGARTGSAPNPSYLLDELSGTYTTFAGYVSDPPLLYGQTGQPSTLYRNRSR